MSGSQSDFSPLFGSDQAALPVRFPRPAVRVVDYQWANLLESILHFGGWTVEEAIFEPKVAEQFGVLWDIAKEIEWRNAGEKMIEELREVLWWRRQGCPVPCPFCGADEDCGCPDTIP
jgi:hypothetical protein